MSSLPEGEQIQALAELQEKGGLSISDVRERKQETTATDDNTAPAAKPTPPPAPSKPYEPKTYPETPPDFEEGQDDEPEESESTDFADLSAADKAEAAIAFLNRKRFTLFAPGEDTRILDFVIDTLADIAE